MVDATSTDGAKRNASRAIHRFPMQFRGNENANSGKETRLWAAREAFLSYSRIVDNRGIPFSITPVKGVGFKRVFIMARTVRGRKRAAWVEALHIALQENFDRFQKTGLKFNANLLCHLALCLVRESSNADYQTNMID